MLAAGLLLVFAACLVAYAADWLWHDAQVYQLHAVARDIREGKPVANAEIARVLQRAIALDEDTRLALLGP